MAATLAGVVHRRGPLVLDEGGARLAMHAKLAVGGAVFEKALALFGEVINLV